MKTDFGIRNYDRNIMEFMKTDKTCYFTFTTNAFIKKIEQLSIKYPDKCRIIARNPDGSVEGKFPSDWIDLSPKYENLNYSIEEVKEKQKEKE